MVGANDNSPSGLWPSLYYFGILTTIVSASIGLYCATNCDSCFESGKSWLWQTILVSVLQIVYVFYKQRRSHTIGPGFLVFFVLTGVITNSVALRCIQSSVEGKSDEEKQDTHQMQQYFAAVIGMFVGYLLVGLNNLYNAYSSGNTN